MSNCFADTSALVKRYMPETGTMWTRKLISRNTIFVAQVTAVEIMSAISRQYHDGAIDLSTLQAFRRQVTYHMQMQYRVVGMTNSILSRALGLHETHRLRAYDSVQLASALEVNHRAVAIGETVAFLAADIRLLEAAAAEGLKTDNPDDHP
jgi:uncharacterized protein